jgi:hypothetical protein
VPFVSTSISLNTYMVARNWTQYNKTNFEAEGVETCYLIVDYINTMSSETADPNITGTTTAGLELVRNIVGSHINILGQTALYNSNSEQAFLVRKDAVSTTLTNAIQDDLRTLASDSRTAGSSSLIGYWSQTTAVDSSLKKNYKLTFDSAPSDTNNFTASLWFRGTSADMESTLPGATEVTYLVSNFAGSESGKGGFLVILESAEASQGARIQANIYQGDGGGALTCISQPTSSASFDATYLNNAWHHVFVQIRADLTGDAATNQNKIYLDGVDKTTTAWSELSGAGGTAEVAAKTSFAGDGTNLRETNLDIADCWVDFGTATDFRSNIGYWYGAGHVDQGSDGTGGGAPQPSIWVHESGGSVVHGGKTAGTVATEGDGSGVVTVYEADGPRGSGLSSSCTVTASDFATKTTDAVTPTNIPT